MARHGDEDGLFFRSDDPDPRALVMLPESDWRPPEDLPDKLHGLIGFDLETRDPELTTAGPGWAWADGGEVVGYAIAADNFRGYLPIRHRGGGNLPVDMVHRWLNHVLADETQPKVGANVMYDVGWSWRDGVTVKGPVYDVQWAEALLDEHRRAYNLDAVADHQLGRTKDEELLKVAAKVFGAKNHKAELYKIPPNYVGPYAEIDAELARECWLVQAPQLQAEGLWDVVMLEHELLPLYVQMRRTGVRVDMDRAAQLKVTWQARIKELLEDIKHRTGASIDIWNAQTIARAFDQEGLSYGRTAKTDQPSITKGFLEHTDHWLAKHIVQAREYDKLCSTFVDGHIGAARNGRIHGEIHPLRSDDGGTVTGRLAMSNPNLQNIPTRTEVGREIRMCFLPDQGDEWASPDFSQQEPRLLVHWASRVRLHDGGSIPGVDQAIEFYNRPDGDIYTLLQEIAGLTRGASKTLTLARIYGRGVTNTAEELQVTYQEAADYFKRFDEALPLAGKMLDICQRQVRRRGYLRSLMGRRIRFPFWEPANWKLRQEDPRMLPREEAEEAWPKERLVRARIHKALNSLIQPSAADQTKLAMRDVWRAGLGGHVRIQVHDELALSVPDRKIAMEVADLMRNAVQLAVPVKVGVGFGPSWGEAK